MAYESGFFVCHSWECSQFQVVILNPHSESPFGLTCGCECAERSNYPSEDHCPYGTQRHCGVTVCILEAVKCDPRRTIDLVVQHTGCQDMGSMQAYCSYPWGTEAGLPLISCTLMSLDSSRTRIPMSAGWQESGLFISSDSD